MKNKLNSTNWGLTQKMRPGFSFQICKFYIKMFINHSWFSSWFNLSTSCNRSPRNPNSLCITNQLHNPAAPSKRNLITNGLDWKLSRGMASRTMLSGRTDTADATSQRAEHCALGPGRLAHPVHCADSDHHGQENLGTPISLDDAACLYSH